MKAHRHKLVPARGTHRFCCGRRAHAVCKVPGCTFGLCRSHGGGHWQDKPPTCPPGCGVWIWYKHMRYPQLAVDKSRYHVFNGTLFWSEPVRWPAPPTKGPR